MNLVALTLPRPAPLAVIWRLTRLSRSILHSIPLYCISGLHAENDTLLRGQNSPRQHSAGEERSHRIFGECH